MSLTGLAQNYGAALVDADGFELEGEALRLSVERAIRRKLGGWLRLVATLGPVESCPALYRGELRAAVFAVNVAERDLAAVTALRGVEAA